MVEYLFYLLYCKHCKMADYFIKQQVEYAMIHVNRKTDIMARQNKKLSK